MKTSRLKKGVQLLTVALGLNMALAGCGSSGGSNNSDTNSTASTATEQPTNNNSSTNSSTLKNSKYVAGVYNISKEINSKTDEAYLYINDNGLITTYDFQGDSVDNGENCYSKNPSNLNSAINNTTLKIDEAKNIFYSGSYQWTYSSAEEKIVKVGVSGITAGRLFSMNGIVIGTSALKVTSPSVNNMEQLLCN